MTRTAPAATTQTAAVVSRPTEKLGIRSADKHTKDELVEQIRKANARETRRARQN